jgi:Domain of unknown function (DUF222)/HNH endonuclease
MFVYPDPMSPTDPTTTLMALQSVDVATQDADGCARLLGEAKRVRGWLDSFEAKVTHRVDELHDTQGAAPAAELHAKCGGVSSAEGKRKERRSKVLDDAPSFGDALESGDIGAEHVDALANATAKLDDDIKGRLLDREDDLLDDARQMTPEEFGRSCRDLGRRLEKDAGIQRTQRQRNATFLARKLNARSGMIEGRFALHPELANQIFGPVDRHVKTLITEGAQAGDPDCQNRTVDRNRLAAEALGELVAAGNQHLHPGTSDITVIVTDRTLETGELDDHAICETSDGSPVPPASIRRLVCGGNITPIYVDANGNPFDFGRTIRHANRAQRRALRALYRTCAFHGCDVTFDRCEIHHIIPWEQGGPTDLVNLIALCSRHHHLVHEDGWSLELDIDRTLTIRQPDGQIFATCVPDVPPRSSRTSPDRRRSRRRRTGRQPAA